MSTMTQQMDGIAAAITSVENVYPWPVESITPPCVVVGWPSDIEYDETMCNGGNTWTYPVYFAVGRSMTAAARDVLSAATVGTTSVKTQLDGAHTWGDVRVIRGDVMTLTVNGIDYLAVRFETEVLG